MVWSVLAGFESEGLQGTYHCQSAYDLTRWVDVAVHELADEVGCHADYGDHGDDAEASRDKEGLRQRSGGGHVC